MRLILTLVTFSGLLFSLSACDAIPFGSDHIECRVTIQWQERESVGTHHSSNVGKAFRKSIKEACKRACYNEPACTEQCRKDVRPSDYSCTDRANGQNVSIDPPRK